MTVDVCLVCGAPRIGDGSFCSSCGSRFAGPVESARIEPVEQAPAAQPPLPVSDAVPLPPIEPVPAPAYAVPPPPMPVAVEPPPIELAATSAYAVPPPPMPGAIEPPPTELAATAAYAVPPPPVDPALPPYPVPPPAIEPAATAAQAEPTAPTVAVVRGRTRLSRGRLAAAATVVVVAALAIAAFLVLRPSDDYRPLGTDLITRLGNRDATAASLLEPASSLPNVATQMGLVGIPDSVTLSVEKIKTSSPQPTAGATSLTNGGQLITATFTVTARGPDGIVAHADETLTARATKGADGKARLADVHIAPPLAFDAEAYFGTAGTSGTDATQVADDLTKGNKWIPGVVVTVVPNVASLTVPDEVTESPDHLTSYRVVTAPGTEGSRTTWAVKLTSDASAAPIVDFDAATTVTTEPVATQVTVGSLSDSDAVAEATAAIDDLTAKIRAGNVAAVNDAILPGDIKIDASGLAAMKRTMPESGSDGSATEEDGTVTVTVGDFVVVRGTDGTWSVDAGQSTLVASERAGNSAAHVIDASLTGTVNCTTKITIGLVRVDYYTDGTIPIAQFSFVSSKSCAMNDSIMAAVITWKGHGTASDILGLPIDGSQPGATAYRFMPLILGVTPSVGPLTITITQYGSPGSLLPNKMVFTTK